MDIKINIVELASELAVNYIDENHPPHLLYIINDKGDFASEYTPYGQLVFDARYDYYYEMIEKYKID